MKQELNNGELKFLDYLGDNKYLVEILPNVANRLTEIKVAHDYVQINDSNIFCSGGELCDKIVAAKGNNVISYNTRIQLPIHQFVNTILPFFNENKYCKPEHSENYAYSYGNVLYRKDDVGYIDVYVKHALKPITILAKDFKKFKEDLQYYIPII